MAIIIPPVFPPNTIAVAPGGPSGSTGTPFSNPSTAALTYKGSSIALEWEADIPVWETPFVNDPKPYVYRLMYQVKASAFLSLPLYAPGPFGGQHVGESNFKTSKGGILSFYREFARKPDSRSEFESYIYPHQVLTYGAITGFSTGPVISRTTAVSDASLTEVPVRVPSRVQYDYFDTTSPASIPLPKAPRAIVVGTTGYMLHGWGALVAGDQMLAEDATLRLWKGKIYEREMRFVEVQQLGNEL